MGKKSYLLFLLGCLLGINSQPVSAGDASGGFIPKESEEQPTADNTDEKEFAQQPFKVGQRIALPVDGAVYSVERKHETPNVLTISLQLEDGTEQVLGLVPMNEVQLMLEDAKVMGSGLPRALLGSSFISYAFGHDEPLLDDIPMQHILTTAKVAQQFIQAEAVAHEQQNRMSGKEQGDSEEAADEDEEEGDDKEAGDGNEDVNLAADELQATQKEESAQKEEAVLQSQEPQNGTNKKEKSFRGLVN